MRSHRRKRNNGEIPGSHRCEAGMLHVGIRVSTVYGLSDEEDGGRTEDRHPMGLYKTSGGH